MTKISIDLWKQRLAQIDRSHAVGTTDLKELREALSMLVALADEIDAWKATAEHWEQEVSAAHERLEQEREERAAVERELKKRVEKLDALVKLMRGKVDPMREVIIEGIREELFRTSPERIDELAREVYRECMKKYGLDDLWDIESPSRRRDIGLTMEVVLRILEQQLKESVFQVK